MDLIHARSCGLDVHKKSVVACVLTAQPDGTVERHMRTFKTMTADLFELAAWLDPLDQDRLQHGAGGVDRRRVARRSRTDDDDLGVGWSAHRDRTLVGEDLSNEGVRPAAAPTPSRLRGRQAPGRPLNLGVRRSHARYADQNATRM